MRKSLAPRALRKDMRLEKHGDIRWDPYYWLNNREDTEVISYLESENAYREEVFKPIAGMEKALFDEMVARIPPKDESVPVCKNGYWYYSRFEERREYPLHCRKRDENGEMASAEEVLLDVNDLAREHTYCSVSGLFVTPDCQKMAFGVDFVSRRLYTIYFKDLVTGVVSEECIDSTSGAAVWANDGEHIFYSTKDTQTLRVNQIWRKRIGQKNENPVLVFEESDEAFSCSVYKSKSKKYLLISSGSSTSDELWYWSADCPTDMPQLFQKREPGLEYSASHFDSSWFIRTNKDGATNFKIMRTPEEETIQENWRDFLAHRPSVFLEGMELFRDFWVIEERENALTKIHIHRWDGKQGHALSFDAPCYTAFVGSNPDFDSSWLRFGYTSLVTPSSIYDYHMLTREKRLRKQAEVVGGYDEKAYTTERLWATAVDGTQIPLSIVYPAERKGPIPFLVYGYGSYGISIDPSFSSTRLSLLQRGFGYCIAHIRGGQDLGRTWYDQGKMEHKMNSFTDFLDCTDALLRLGWASPGHLYAMGGSAGGLLMGAIINKRPELFRGVVAAVPFVDVVTTMLDETIPLTTGEYEEWGNPNEADAYFRMKSYSPYDQTEAKAYPALLVTTGLHDSQVQYWEPAKWVAKMRHVRTQSTPLLLHCNMETGHGGASGRFEAYKEVAMEYAFLLGLESGDLPLEGFY